MTEKTAAEVHREIVVDVPVEKAFRVFTERFGDIKPKEHNIMRSPITETRFEPHVGGHIYDLAEDGSECRWARVLAYEPPRRVYRLDPAGVLALRDQLDTFWSRALNSFEDVASSESREPSNEENR